MSVFGGGLGWFGGGLGWFGVVWGVSMDPCAIIYIHLKCRSEKKEYSTTCCSRIIVFLDLMSHSTKCLSTNRRDIRGGGGLGECSPGFFFL